MVYNLSGVQFVLMLDPFLVLIQWFVIFILLRAAWGKLVALNDFKSNLEESFRFSGKISRVIAPTLVVYEITLFILIISKTNYSYISMLVALFTFFIFTLVLCYRWVQDSRVRCNCFGNEDRTVSIFDLIRNIIIILLIGLYLIWGPPEHDLHLGSLFLLALLGLILSTVVIRFHDIAMLLLSAQGRV